MLLVIDAGNTNIKLGVFRGTELVAQWRLLTDGQKPFAEYGEEIQNRFDHAGIALTEIEGIAITSVVPRFKYPLHQIARVWFRLTPLFLDPSTDTGLKIIYDSPSELGTDRIVGAVAAVAKYGAPCIVVDCGTATTFNAVNAAHEFIGGVIAPGVATSAEALFSRAPKLPRVHIERPNKVIATSTIGAMQSGLYYGYAGLIDGVLSHMIAELRSQPRVIATGGLAPLIADASKFIEEVDRTLTLDGLRLIYERNKKPV